MLPWKRRSFIKSGAFGAAAFSLFPEVSGIARMMKPSQEGRFKISLAQWSLHRALQGGRLNHLDFAAKAANDFGIYGVEYVNQFFADKALDRKYLAQMNERARDHGVKQLLIMVDGEGGLAEPDDATRKKAVSNHYKWVEAARYLDCHSIRVNAYGAGHDRSGLHAAAVDGLGELALYAANIGIHVIVENHGGLSSDGKWLASVIREINLPNCGTLPDFGNFCLRHEDDGKGGSRCAEEYDRYTGVEELLPFARAVSAKSHDFDPDGNETNTDFARMISLVKKSNYSGYIGIEYEGSRLSEEDGIMATKKLLERLIS